MAPKAAVAEHPAAAKAVAKTMHGLPVMVATPVDLGRLIRELELLDDLILQNSHRDEKLREPIRTSRLLDQTLELNKVDLMEENERHTLHTFLESIRAKAPVLHMSFSADPSPVFLERLVAWLRKEIHPLVLVTVGLQPNLGAGCIVRSTNKYFDLSLRQDFAKKRELLMATIKEKMAQSPAEAPETTGVPA